MGLMDKLKNVFFEEEYVEVEEPERKEKPKKQEKVKKQEAKEEKIAKKIEVPKKEAKVESKREESKPTRREDRELEAALFGEEEPQRETFSDRDLLQPETAFRLFDDDDFMQEEKPPVKVPPSSSPSSESRQAYGGDYRPFDANLYKGESREKSFKPTPIISPIYGILDQNYSKDDIVDKNNRVVSSSYAKKMDLDTVREKAYGGLSSDFGLSEDTSDMPSVANGVEESPIQDNLLYDMSDSGAPAVEKVTIADAEEYFEDLGLEYNIDYKDKSQDKASGRRVQRIPDDEMESDAPKHSKKEIKVDEPYEDDDDDDATLEDNLFDLIDSMYEERE